MQTKDSVKEIPADSVIASIGNNAGAALAGEKPEKNVHVLGDANTVSNIKKAIWAANYLALER